METRRLGQSEERLALDALRAVKWRHVPELADPSLDAVARWLANRANVFCMATEHGHPVGFCVGHILDRVDGRSMVLVYEIEVLPSHRRRGAGRGLLVEMQRLAQEARALKAWVVTTAANQAARGLYRSLGWTEREEMPALFVWESQECPEVNE